MPEKDNFSKNNEGEVSSRQSIAKLLLPHELLFQIEAESIWSFTWVSGSTAPSIPGRGSSSPTFGNKNENPAPSVRVLDYLEVDVNEFVWKSWELVAEAGDVLTCRKH